MDNIYIYDALSDCEKAKICLKKSVDAYQKLNNEKNDTVLHRVNAHSFHTYVNYGSTDFYKETIKSLSNDILVWDAIVKVSCSNDK
jgi:hypothetical protein